ncbi:MOSC domain-containing protein, partial [Streptomyces sp. NPDC002587]
YVQYEDAPPPCDAPHLAPRADPPGITGQPLGENITTSGIDLLGLPVGTLLRIGDAVLEVTGLRNPCLQIDNFQDGLLKQVVGRDEAGNIVRKAGIMSIVKEGGAVRPGDTIRAELPSGPHQPLERV